ncbi:aldehyde dehydrogenase 3 family, member D1 [Gamsiella multidivaricata]|uniref:aldehyde dehydrogenase 3 family, member D1 n=1 Tax=Gamsiella multidivaricata TaxID=101098 RepID=UPI00221F303B|nr:aldehyde dehydrogenase 3 family, member D1 [Gamsiella multidivaricata]KAI7819406.1 aldehyde dehydrogenase 3 family, member D1 [Gamsiella multidivaricata]
MADLAYTPLTDIPSVVQDLRATFKSGLTKPLAYRKEQLKGLHNLVAENEAAIREAAYLDLHKPPLELFLGETGMLKQECVDAIKNLDSWAAPEKVKGAGFAGLLDTALIRKEPVGIVLIIGAWNYPLNLLLVPAVGAIAAGNTVLLKPSEVSSHMAALVTKLLPRYLDSRSYRIVNGGPEQTMGLLSHKFDHIFYTGSGNVGKVIMGEAAKQLTPVTLELGGKSPVFIAKNLDLSVVARRLVSTKFFNCGQSCIAPDYVLIERGGEQELVKHMKAVAQEFYGVNPQTSNHYARIVNKRHFHRVKKMIDNTKGRVVIGGDTQEDDLFVAPTVILDVQPDDASMEDEIFGPILPIMVVDSLEQGVEYVGEHDQPLALYIFSQDKKQINYILDNTRSGGVVVNDLMIHFAFTSLPFGGTGPSGIGNYHQKKSFDTFSHERSTLIKSLSMERANSIRYPPYSEKKISWLQWILYNKAKFGPNAANPGADKAKL